MATNDQRQARETSRSVSIKKEKKTYNADQVYCYCREPGGDRFMIGCDACDEWYHGDCIQLSSTKGRRIDKYYCPTCVSKNPELTTTYKMKGYDWVANPVRCTECVACTKQPDCGKCARCKAKDGRCMEVVCLMEKVKNEEEEYQKKQHQKPPPRREAKIEEVEDDDVVFVKETKRIPRGEKGWKKQLKDEKKAKRGKCGHNMESATKISGRTHVRNEPLQCWGPECIYEAREGSKFCSDECGKALARERIKYLTKNAPNHWNAEPVDERLAREERDRKAQEMGRLEEDKKKLDKWHTLIINYVNTLKNCFKPHEVKHEPDDNGAHAVKIHCVVCGEEHGSLEISKHVEHCFNKQEKKTTFTSYQKGVNPQNILCETEDSKKKTFCKRLRVLCPEHYKGEIEEGLLICGWPKVWNYEGSKSLNQLFDFPKDIIDDGLCRVGRKECNLHCGWITTILGLLDARRFAYHLRVEQEQVREQEEGNGAKKGNAWLLMANETEHHQPLEQILKQYEEGAKNPPPTTT